MGLCVGHDSLFYKYSKALVTTLVARTESLRIIRSARYIRQKHTTRNFCEIDRGKHGIIYTEQNGDKLG